MLSNVLNDANMEPPTQFLYLLYFVLLIAILCGIRLFSSFVSLSLNPGSDDEPPVKNMF